MSMASSSSSSSSSINPHQSPTTLKAYFKTPEGRYKLQYEKSYPSGLLHYAHGKSASQVTLAHLGEKPAAAASNPSASSSVKFAAKFLVGGTGGRALSFVGGNGIGASKSVVGTGSSNRGGVPVGLGVSHTSGSSPTNPNYDGKGTYLIFNVGDTIFVSDFNSQDKDPIKSIHFSTSIPVCHAFDPEAKDGHDLLIGLSTGDVYSASLRHQLQDFGKKLVGGQHYSKDGSVTNSRCTSVAWVPGGNGAFVVAHADGNLYVYEKSKDGAVDTSFPTVKDQTQFVVAHARSSRSNPMARWHICQVSINNIAFSTDGMYLATVDRDGYLRVFDFPKEQLICGGKSYYGALLCCAWSMDGKYILTGGEDDLVHVWSMDDQKVVAWGEGHNSWVSGVSFDSYWASPASDGEESAVYRFGSVGQDTQLLLWDLSMDEIVVPIRRCPPGGSPRFSSGGQSSHWESSSCPVGTLHPAPSMRDVPKLSPLVSHKAHHESLSSIVFTQDSIVTGCREGHVKIWMRPRHSESLQGNSESILSTSLKDKPLPAAKVSSSSYK